MSARFDLSEDGSGVHILIDHVRGGAVGYFPEQADADLARDLFTEAYEGEGDAPEALEAPPAPAPLPDGLRALTAVNARGLEIARPGGRPSLRWVPLDRIAVSERYQREFSERSVAMIRRAAAEFEWRRLKPPVVVQRADGWFEALDGQHTVAILALVGEAEAPCLVVPDTEDARKAAAFVGLNTSRVAVTPLHRHRAAVASGDEAACAVMRAAELAGARVLDRPPANARYAAGDTVAVSTLAAIARRRGVAGLAAILRPCVAAGLAPIGTDALRAVEALLCEPGWKGEIGEAALTRALRHLAAHREAAEAARKISGQPLWRALAVELFRGRAAA